MPAPNLYLILQTLQHHFVMVYLVKEFGIATAFQEFTCIAKCPVISTFDACSLSLIS